MRFVSWKWGLQLQRGRQRSPQADGGEGCPVPGASCASLESSLVACSVTEIAPYQCTSTNRVLFKRGNLDPDTHPEGHDPDMGKGHHLQPRAGAWTGAPSTLQGANPAHSSVLDSSLLTGARTHSCCLGTSLCSLWWQPRHRGRVRLRLGQLQAQGLPRLSRGQGGHTDLQPGGVG